MKRTLFLEPSDVLLFRDGRSFSAGDQLATGHFPPHPTTVYGALRSALLSQSGADFHKADFGLKGTGLADVVGTKTAPGALSLTGFSLAHRTGDGVEALYPVPGDVLINKEDKGKPFADVRGTYLVPVQRAASGPDVAGRTNMPGDLLPLWPAASAGSDNPTYTGAEGWLSAGPYAQLLRGSLQALQHAIPPGQLFSSEPRTSVSIEAEARTATEGHLFSVQFTRPHEGIGFLVEVDAPTLDLTPSGWLRLGGEARAVRYETVDEGSAQVPPGYGDTAAAKGSYLKLTLVTAAPFSGGWLPDGFDPDTLRGEVAGVPCRLAGAAVGTPQHLGGWDVAAGRPKPTRRAVPAGSTYFVEVDSVEQRQELLQRRTPVSLIQDDDLQRQGLGLAHFGISSA
ncbi:MAG: type III-B CRISPR module-associated protein Cmr3 [Bacteroidetes bacterium]|jgi:CRISPR-associated protein Cmr3|nr:type III-B CRISPR module-associated protein Cmr3 [Bacteroidota bacterium]